MSYYSALLIEKKQSFGHSATGLCLCPHFLMGFSYFTCCPTSVFSPPPFLPSIILFPPTFICSLMSPAEQCIAVSPPAMAVECLPPHPRLSIKVLSKKTIASSPGTSVPAIQMIHFFFTLQQSECLLCIRSYK